MSSALSSEWVRTYRSRYHNLQKQAAHTLKHPAMPLFLLLGVLIWVGLALVHVWVRVQLVSTRREIREQQKIQQSLIDQQKRIDLENATYQGRVGPYAQEEWDMSYINHRIPLRMPSAKQGQP